MPAPCDELVTLLEMLTDAYAGTNYQWTPDRLAECGGDSEELVERLRPLALSMTAKVAAADHLAEMDDRLQQLGAGSGEDGHGGDGRP